VISPKHGRPIFRICDIDYISNFAKIAITSTNHNFGKSCDTGKKSVTSRKKADHYI
jgi:hypothetical protein